MNTNKLQDKINQNCLIGQSQTKLDAKSCNLALAFIHFQISTFLKMSSSFFFSLKKTYTNANIEHIEDPFFFFLMN